MIDRVLERGFVLWQLASLLTDDVLLAREVPAPAAPLPRGFRRPSNREARELAAALSRSVAAERQRVLSTSEPDDERSREEPPPLEQRVWVPRDPLLSIGQSAIEWYLIEHRSDLLEPIETVDGDRPGDDTPPLVDVRLKLDDDAVPDELAVARARDIRHLGTPFENTDPGWLSSVTAMGYRFFKRRHPFPRTAAPPTQLASTARLVVVGDWASGLPGAQMVATEMRSYVEEAADEGRECHVIHLGDTYYAGWAREYRNHFLPYWPVAPGEPHGSWSLAGNHDMHTGGKGYYEVLLREERFAPFHRGSSWFSLENKHWQILALDSAWDDHALHGGQAGWVARKLADNPKRKTMLLSHHQPFSAYNNDGKKLRRALAGPLSTGRIDAWLWGHEHRCAVYEPRDRVAAPRLVGHGGMPAYADPAAKKKTVRWVPPKSFPARRANWALMGFAVLDFDGPTITVRYVDMFGRVEKFVDTLP